LPGIEITEPLRTAIAASALTALLGDAGFRIEGPGAAEDGELCGRFWWTLTRDSWGSTECGDDFGSGPQARADAVRALLTDEDLDWTACVVREHAVDDFALDFPARMAGLA
jgi:hypothetical protein